MFYRAVPLLLLLLVASLLIVDTEAGRRRRSRRRDPRVYDTRPSDIEHDDDDDDDDDEDDDDDDDEDHDPGYDREAFLGRDGAKQLAELSPEQAKQTLLELLPKIDVNNDTKISQEELQKWLSGVAQRERRLSSDKRFEAVKLFNHELDVNAPLTFDQYKKSIYHDIVGDAGTDKQAIEEFNNRTVRDQARWAKADANGDKLLNKDEFADFLRPEEAPRMRDVVIQEAMMSTDKNKDGKIDLNEFMHDLFPSYEADVKAKKKLPKWVEKEEKLFKEKLDTNKDGFLDPTEVYKWIVPDDYDHSRKETEHLLKLADKDNDKNLTKDEIMNNWRIFVGHKPESESGGSRHEEL